MRFMLLRKADKQTEAGVLLDAKLLAVMGSFMTSAPSPPPGGGEGKG